MIKSVIRDLLVADSTITSALDTYPFVDGAAEAPAVFTTPMIPKDSRFPAIIISHIGGTPFGCREQRGATLYVDVRVYDDKETSMKALDDLAFAVWKRCDRADLTALLAAKGYEDWGCTAGPPTMNNDSDGYPGYLIKVQSRVLEA